jgi:transcriptional regulator with XRE-family HTH domain
MSLQEKLTNLRKEQKLSQLEVAEAISVSRQAVSKWEAGTTVPSTDNLKFLSDLYGVSVDYLLDNSADIPDPPEEDAMEAQVQPALRKRFTLERKLIVALSCAVVLLLAALVYSKMPQETEEVPVTPIRELEVEEEDNAIDGEFSFLW